MRGRHARVRIALEDGRHVVAVLFAVGAPERRALLKDTVIRQSVLCYQNILIRIAVEGSANLLGSQRLTAPVVKMR